MATVRQRHDKAGPVPANDSSSFSYDRLSMRPAAPVPTPKASPDNQLSYSNQRPEAPASRSSLSDQLTQGLESVLDLFAGNSMAKDLNNTPALAPAAAISFAMTPQAPAPGPVTTAKQEPAPTPHPAPAMSASAPHARPFPVFG